MIRDTIGWAPRWIQQSTLQPFSRRLSWSQSVHATEETWDWEMMIAGVSGKKSRKFYNSPESSETRLHSTNPWLE